MPQTMKLLGSIEIRRINHKNGKNVSLLEITKVVLVHFNIFSNSCEHHSTVLYTLVPNRLFGNY